MLEWCISERRERTVKVKTVDWTPGDRGGTVAAFLSRPAFDAAAEVAAAKVLAAVRKDGEKAVLRCARKFDGVTLRPGQLRVGRPELEEARQQVDRDLRRSAQETRRRVAAFARAGMKKDWSMASPRGGRLGERFSPLGRVGVYIPGGAAPLASTVLMTVTLAQVAGVPEIVACTPCDEQGRISPALLYALDLAGATEIYRVGGIQAIGLMAYGTRTVRPVDKIVGPGGPYVTAAKRQVYGHVALDLVAGPSEIAVLADESADPRHVAVALLSQAEHGTGHEKALLVTTSRKLAARVAKALAAEAATLSTRDSVQRVADRGGILLVVVRNLDEGVELCNRFAPEHLEVMVDRPSSCLPAIRHAGAIFLGKWTPESAGDFAAGPSHVLPTGGAARMFSGLTVDDFRKRSSVMALTQADLREILPVIETFGRVEGLDAHARSARVRFETR